MATTKVKGSLYELVFRALGSSPLVGLTPKEQVKVANHVARKLGGSYVKTRAGWKRELAKVASAKWKELDSLRDELAELRMAATHTKHGNPRARGPR